MKFNFLPPIGGKPYNELGFTYRLLLTLKWSLRLFRAEGFANQATSLTFYTVFAVVPLLALFFGIAQGFGLDDRFKAMLENNPAISPAVLDYVYLFIDTTLRQARGGVIAGVGVVILFGTVVMLAARVEDTFNTIWSLPKRKNIIHKLSNYLAILVVTPILLIIIGSSPVIERAANSLLMAKIPAAGAVMPYMAALTEFLPLLLLWAAFTFIYYCTPNTRVRFGAATLGALLAGVMFYSLQSSLVHLQLLLSGYNAIYGSFSIIPLFLLWLQWSWMIILFGAEIAFVRQNAATGRFESDTFASTRLRRAYLLATLRIICRKFNGNLGATSEKELMRNLQLSAYCVNMLLAELVTARIILPVEQHDGMERFFLPNLPMAQLTPVKIFAILDNIATGNGNSWSAPAVGQLLETMQKLENAAENSPANRPVGDL